LKIAIKIFFTSLFTLIIRVYLKLKSRQVTRLLSRSYKRNKIVKSKNRMRQTALNFLQDKWPLHRFNIKLIIWKAIFKLVASGLRTSSKICRNKAKKCKERLQKLVRKDNWLKEQWESKNCDTWANGTKKEKEDFSHFKRSQRSNGSNIDKLALSNYSN
jgi:hypothetical protein